MLVGCQRLKVGQKYNFDMILAGKEGKLDISRCHVIETARHWKDVVRASLSPFLQNPHKIEILIKKNLLSWCHEDEVNECEKKRRFQTRI